MIDKYVSSITHKKNDWSNLYFHMECVDASAINDINNLITFFLILCYLQPNVNIKVCKLKENLQVQRRNY